MRRRQKKKASLTRALASHAPAYFAKVFSKGRAALLAGIRHLLFVVADKTLKKARKHEQTKKGELVRHSFPSKADKDK